ncbi:hypothetical protein QE361_000116 [Sphingomonas sp. SORGH_AS802]|uniref:ATP-binding protein n=1 Tax=unclassified Sphingomonas TaxID=196159 RepID=UPI0028552450|nr:MULTISPECIES: ATP-binding protein [unclassified Sphingomonas]MDR6127932.1 hypothetical protein [Sphingomonas sp. SORGH_AS_0438]MDR6133158.1 hypothetical protein [Sphingomonas sp. SORGH_AS_0802]
MASSGMLFGDKFLTQYAGPIIADPSVAIVELVANAWDAHATRVDIDWPREGRPFRIRDDGGGMRPGDFMLRWRMLNYDRIEEQGGRSVPPPDLPNALPRTVYGKNGKGRHAAFLFGDPYRVRTWRDGTEAQFVVSRCRTMDRAFDVDQVKIADDVQGHGTEITGSDAPLGFNAGQAREIIGSRFLTDPGFVVTVDGTPVSFEDLSDDQVAWSDVEVPGLGTARVLMIDGQKADKTTRQHGIAWWVNNRLVGDCRWRGTDLMTVIDGRTSEAKRFTFIVLADFLENSVKADWSDFDPSDDAWKEARSVVVGHIRELVADAVSSRKAELKTEVHERIDGVARILPPLSRERVRVFVDKVAESCPSLTTDELSQVSGILARLELSSSKYALLGKLHDLPPGDLDSLNQLLSDWTLHVAKDALDQIQVRLKLIRQMHETLRDKGADEVQDLQPLFNQSLWAFGPEYETIEFTSNMTMATVITKLFKGDVEAMDGKPTRNRPDFAILPDSSVGLYSRPAYGQDDGEPYGVDHLVIVELKRPGIVIRDEQMEQARKYARELRRIGQISDGTKVTCFVLGSELDMMDTEPMVQGRMTTKGMTFENFIRRAESRMLNLYASLKDAPFLNGQEIDDFVNPPGPAQPSLYEGAAANM